jgi:hypothetical protein
MSISIEMMERIKIIEKGGIEKRWREYHCLIKEV